MIELPSFDDETDFVVQTTARIDSGFQLEVDVISEHDEDRRTLLAHCDHLLDCHIEAGFASHIELTHQHPLLWEYQYDSASAYFSGVPKNPMAALGSLVEAHWSAVGEWIPISKFLNFTKGIRPLLGVGNGLLAQGPIPLLQVYDLALREHGTEVQIISPYPPGGRLSDPEIRARIKNESKVLTIGDSYVIGTGWHFKEPQSPPAAG